MDNYLTTQLIYSTDPGVLPIVAHADPIVNDPFKKQVGGDHYKNFKIQPGDFIAQNDLKWYEGNVIKYICRNRFKGKRLEDLEKCKHYVELAIALAKKEEDDVK